ncbi:MAG: histone H1 [Planctomycetes bacterium]|nr:histone H1 [Planctomycetota bacterium]
MEHYELLKKKVEAAAEDIAKACGGNKAAGTRVRKAMQDIKASAQDIRIKVLEICRQPPKA